MSYCLLKNAFPKQSIIEQMEDTPSTPDPDPTQVTPIASLDASTSFIPSNNHSQPIVSTQPQLSLASPAVKHIDSVNHLLECITCRDELLSRMSFYDKNRDIVDMLPYVILIALLILIFKKF